jgi:hypothetical protein
MSDDADEETIRASDRIPDQELEVLEISSFPDSGRQPPVDKKVHKVFNA